MTIKEIEEIENQIFQMIINFRNSKNSKKLLNEYNKELEQKLPKVLSKEDIKSLNYRREKREYFSFFLHVYEKTEKETKIIQLWKSSLEKKGFVVDIINNGIDNNGLPKITKSDKSKNNDFEVFINGDKLSLDLKISPTCKCFTFKVDDLKRYIEDDIRILLVLSEDFDPKYWNILTKDFMMKLVNNVYGERGNHFKGFKKTCRVYRNDDLDTNILGYDSLIKNNLFELTSF